MALPLNAEASTFLLKTGLRARGLRGSPLGPLKKKTARSGSPVLIVCWVLCVGVSLRHF